MRHHVKHYFRRHEPKGHVHLHLKSCIGAIIGMAAVGSLATVTHLPLLIAPFGASAVLLFGQPKSPLAQPANVVGGYLVTALLALAVTTLFPGMWLAGAVGVGLAIALMQLLRVTHPPAGAVPLVAIAGQMNGVVLLEVAMIGSVLLVAIATLHHLIPPRQQYPIRIEESPARVK